MRRKSKEKEKSRDERAMDNTLSASQQAQSLAYMRPLNTDIDKVSAYSPPEYKLSKTTTTKHSVHMVCPTVFNVESTSPHHRAATHGLNC